jgi:cytoskeletal protein CcmA (bactofilin family)
VLQLDLRGHMLKRLSRAESSALRARTVLRETVAITPPDTTPDAVPGGIERADLARSQSAMDAVSVIGNEVSIIGKELEIVSRGTLRLNGEIEADVKGCTVILGEQAKVTGTIVGQRVTIAGKVCGVIRGNIVVLEASSEVIGDIYHRSLAIKEGAQFKGHSCRAAVEADLNAGGRHLSVEKLNLAIKRLRAATSANQPMMQSASAIED